MSLLTVENQFVTKKRNQTTVNTTEYSFSVKSHDSRGKQHAMAIKKWACFAKSDICAHRCDGEICQSFCSNIFQITIITYHFVRLVIAIYTYFFLQTLCIPFRLNILLGKASTLLIYLFGLLTLRKSDLFYLIKKSFKSITTAKWLLLIIAISVPYVTGIIVACTLDYSTTDHEIPFLYHLVVEVSDLLRYWPSSAVVLLLYGFLDTFYFKIDDFNTKKLDFSVLKYDNYDHVEFMTRFNNMTEKYRIVLANYSGFIVVFFIDVLFLWATMFISIILDYYHSDCSYATIEYVHYFAETMFYCLLWTVMIYKLHICHAQIVSYKHNFDVKVGITNNSNAIQKLLIKNYLDTIIQHRSPFAFFGIKPDTKTIVIVFSSVLLPATTQILHFIYNYDIV
eukprot:333904_1